MSATAPIDIQTESTWRVTRDGAVVAVVDVRQEQGDVVVAAGSESGARRPYRFDTLQAADAFMSDLMTSFSYLGCDVSRG